MVWLEKGGGGDDPHNHNNDDETDTLLEQSSVTSPEVEERPQVNVGEEQPLIEAANNGDTSSKKCKTPSLSRREHVCEPRPPMPVATPPVSSRSTRIPVMVTLDPAERVSLNTGIPTRGMSPSPCRGASTASDIINPKSSSEGPILPMTRPSTIPMLPTNHNQLASHEAIQVATVVDTSGSTPKSYDFDQHQYNICSSQALCGPHPKKVVIVIAIILSIWASFILGINIHKKVLTMEDKLASMTQKMLDLQIKYLDLQVASNEEITRLHHKVNDLTEKSLQKETSFARPPPPPSSSRGRGKVDKRSRIVTTTKSTTTTTSTTTSTKGECMTKKGAKCILSFKFNGQDHDGCIHRWQDTAPWCPLAVDENGSYDSSFTFGYCDDSCPSTTGFKNDPFANWG